MSDLILYQTPDGRTRLDLRVEDATVWLTQLEIAELFQTTKQNVSLHAKNIFEDGELNPKAIVKESLTTAADGKRYKTLLYNLDLIFAIGYRVRSPRGVQFRQWASTHLKEFIVKGFVMDDDRLKDPGGWDYAGCLSESRSEMFAEMKTNKIDLANMALTDLGILADPRKNMKLVTMHSASIGVISTNRPFNIHNLCLKTTEILFTV